MPSLSSIRRAIAAAHHPHHRSALLPVPGEGPARARIMLVGEAPGKKENQTGRPFVGRAGMFLDAELSSVGLKRKDLFITSVLKYYPKDGKVSSQDVHDSLPWLQQQIRAIRPSAVLLMGRVARSVKEQLPVGPDYFVTAHPAAAMRFPKQRAIFRRHIKAFAKLVRKTSRESAP